MQRKELARSGRAAGPRTPSYPTYTAPVQSNPTDSYESYKTEQKTRTMPVRGKGMMLGKKSKTTNAFEQIRGELGPEHELTPPPAAQSIAPVAAVAASTQVSDREAVHFTIVESISARVSREGSLESFKVNGELQLRITDPALTQIKVTLAVGDVHGAQLLANPKVDKALFKNHKVIQTAQSGQGFPANQSIGIMKWKPTPKVENISDPPITFTVWVNDAGGNTWNITVEYEWGGGDPLRDVLVSIPYATSEPAVSSFDAVYEVSGDSVDWTIGSVDEENSSGSFEFEAQASDDSEFFPMTVNFSKTNPFVEVDVSFDMLPSHSMLLLLILIRSLPLHLSRRVKTSTSRRRYGLLQTTTRLSSRIDCVMNY
jgi:hypothetical protein